MSSSPAAPARRYKLAAGTYDVDVRFNDGAVSKIIWLDGVALSGAVDRTVEVGASIANVTWHITNHGAEVGDAIYEIRPIGQHGGNVVAGGNSGARVRLPAGEYSIDVRYDKGMIHKVIWADHQTLTGTVDRGTDLGLNVARATVTATLNGADIGDKARIGIAPAGQASEVGAMRSGETAELESGHYKLTATMPGAEGTLQDAAIEGQARLVVAMRALRTEELKAGGPPPKACAIEVYGVNFDFDKAVLRPRLGSGAAAGVAPVHGDTVVQRRGRWPHRQYRHAGLQPETVSGAGGGRESVAGVARRRRRTGDGSRLRRHASAGAERHR